MPRQYDIRNGYTPLAHTLLEDMAKMDLTSIEFRIIFWIWRNSYGVHRKTTRPTSEREIGRNIEANPGNVHRALQGLYRRDLVRQKDGCYGFNKYAVGVAERQHPNVITSIITMERCPAATGALPESNGEALPGGNGALPSGNTSNETIINSGLNRGSEEHGAKGAVPAPPSSSGPSPHTGIEKIGYHFINVKKLPMASEAAKKAYIKRRAVWDAAKTLLTLADGDVDRAKAAISDLDVYYADKPWTLGWVVSDYPEWDKERMDNDEKKKVRK